MLFCSFVGSFSVVHLIQTDLKGLSSHLINADHNAVQVVLAGGFAFQIVDRLAGGTFNIAQPQWVYIWVYEPLIGRTPGLWWAW